MKKSITIFLTLITLFCSKANSQSFHGGINAGFTISQVDGDNHGGYHKIAPAGGFYVRNTFRNPNWGISASLLYKNKGSKAVQTDENDIVTLNYKINLHYIELPFLFNYKIERLAIRGLFDYSFKRDLYIEFGPSYAYLLKGAEYFDELDYNTKSFKKYEFALHAGILYRFAEHWLLSYRFSYTFPFLPIHPHPGGQVYWLNRGLYNNNMNFSLIYEF